MFRNPKMILGMLLFTAFNLFAQNPEVIQVTAVNTEDAIDFQVVNLQTYDQTVTLSFLEAENLTFLQTYPYTFVVQGGESLSIPGARITSNKLAWKYNYQYRAVMGRFTASHDDAVLYDLPHDPQKAYRVGQGFNGSFSHFGENTYAIDWDMPEGTEVLAAREGKVIWIKNDSDEGGTEPEFKTKGNIVIIEHSDGTLGEYIHFRFQGVMVMPGDWVSRGDLLGYSGNTGYSSGPHLHFMVIQILEGSRRESVPIVFRTAQGNLDSLTEGEWYSSVSNPVNLFELAEVQFTPNFERQNTRGLKISVQGLSIKALKGKSVVMVYRIVQNNTSVLEFKLKPTVISYSTSVWKEALWTFFPNEVLQEKVPNPKEAFGQFLILEHPSGAILFQQKDPLKWP